MTENASNRAALNALIGEDGLRVWDALCGAIETRYEMETLWGQGGKAWDVEYKYRRGGKTLCAMYAKKDTLGLLIIFGKAERERFEAERGRYSDEVQRAYDEAETYRDGRWVMFLPKDESMASELMSLLAMKRRPNRKAKA